MKAVTHTEVYRPFEGTLHRRSLRFWPLLTAGIRTATKKKLPLLLLYGPPAIATVVFSFIIYGTYIAEQGVRVITDGQGNGVQANMASMFAKHVMQQVQVKNLIVQFYRIMVWFALLGTSWYGSGLFADDRRLGAHQLYFARPLTRLDYLLGKLLIVGFFAACALMLPGILICSMAAFTSPNWSFVREQWDVILETFAYSSVWISIASLAILAVSSLASKRVFSLVGMFAIFVITFAFGALLGEVVDRRFFAVSPIWSIWRVGDALLGGEAGPDGPPLATAVWALAGYATLFLSVISWRVRRLEVVA